MYDEVSPSQLDGYEIRVPRWDTVDNHEQGKQGVHSEDRRVKKDKSKDNEEQGINPSGCYR